MKDILFSNFCRVMEEKLLLDKYTLSVVKCGDSEDVSFRIVIKKRIGEDARNLVLQMFNSAAKSEIITKGVAIVEAVSSNDYPLITQPGNETDMLTVGSGKLYELYIVRKDGSIEEVPFDNETLSNNWYDHCIVPEAFHRLASELDCGYDSETFAHIVYSFVVNYLDHDWTKLHEYLPKEPYKEITKEEMPKEEMTKEEFTKVVSKLNRQVKWDAVREFCSMFEATHGLREGSIILTCQSGNTSVMRIKYSNAVSNELRSKFALEIKESIEDLDRKLLKLSLFD